MKSPRLKTITLTITEAMYNDLKELRRNVREDGFVLSQASVIRQAIRIHTQRTLHQSQAVKRRQGGNSPAMVRLERQLNRKAEQLAFKFDIDGERGE